MNEATAHVQELTMCRHPLLALSARYRRPVFALPALVDERGRSQKAEVGRPKITALNPSPTMALVKGRLVEVADGLARANAP